MSEEKSFTVTEEDAGKRLDSYLSEWVSSSRNAIQHQIENGFVLVNGKEVKPNYKVRVGDEISLFTQDAVPVDIEPEDIPLDIVYEDEDVLVINKPRGMVVHPAPGNESGTLVNAVMYHCGKELSGINGEIRPGIVHRIDKDTTGLLVVAKNDTAHLKLAEQLSDRTLSREYYALVHGNIKTDQGTIDAPIGRHPKDRKKMSVQKNGGREAVTDYVVLERFGTATLVKCKLRTGRTHQIRVHMNYIGHPIYGDPVYGVKHEEFSLDGQLLHAKKMGFIHPSSGEYVSFETSLPTDFERILDIMRKKTHQ